jgi:hypothetical protein
MKNLDFANMFFWELLFKRHIDFYFDLIKEVDNLNHIFLINLGDILDEKINLINSYKC